MEPIKVGLLGFGTVGSGTFTVLRRNQEEIKRRAGRGIEITRIAVRTPSKVQGAEGIDVTTDFNAVVNDPSIDIVAEMIGGTGVARELVLRAIANGKHVVTANKALLAVHGLATPGVLVGTNGVVALSGGYARPEACRLLAMNHGMIASFSRALIDDLRASMSDAAFDATLSEATEAIYQASVIKA